MNANDACSLALTARWYSEINWGAHDPVLSEMSYAPSLHTDHVDVGTYWRMRYEASVHAVGCLDSGLL